MSELGFLNPDEKTELIAGQIILMVAKGRAHVIALQLGSLSHSGEKKIFGFKVAIEESTALSEDLWDMVRFPNGSC
jgi:hypothetical protein